MPTLQPTSLVVPVAKGSGLAKYSPETTAKLTRIERARQRHNHRMMRSEAHMMEEIRLAVLGEPETETPSTPVATESVA